LEYIIKPPKKFSLDLKELKSYRELIYFFIWRDIKVKYKQSILGILWAVVQPFLMMVVLSLFFGTMLKVPSDGVPYPIFIYTALIFWNIFSTGLNSSGNSMVTNAAIIKKIYFPRLVLPMSSIMVSVFDFFIAFTIYIGLVFYYQFDIDVAKVFLILPMCLILTVVATFGSGLSLAALNVKYRDFKYIIPFLIQTLYFLSPVIYSVSSIPKVTWMRVIYSLNPMMAPIYLSRSLLNGLPLDTMLVGISCLSNLLLLMLGIYFFKKSEAYFADIA